jgi:hypothetical protein
MKEETIERICYIIDTVVLIMVLVFSAAETHTAYMAGGLIAALYKLPFMVLAFLLKYVYLLFYIIQKFT